MWPNCLNYSEQYHILQTSDLHKYTWMKATCLDWKRESKMEYYLAHMVILTSLGLSSSTILPFSIFQALGKLITFIHNEYRNMNIDGQFGLAQAQGKEANPVKWLFKVSAANLDIALQQMRACNNQSLVTKIRDTRDEIEVIRNLVNPLLKEHPFKYFVCKFNQAAAVRKPKRSLQLSTSSPNLKYGPKIWATKQEILAVTNFFFPPGHSKQILQEAFINIWKPVLSQKKILTTASWKL